jgi:hypothetical protein
MPAVNEKYEPGISVHQFTGIDGEAGSAKKPLMQWSMEGFINFSDGKLSILALDLMNAARRLVEWSDVPDFNDQIISQRGAADALKTFSSQGSDSQYQPTDAQLRAVTQWLAFCLYINSLKPVYLDGEAKQRRKSEPRTLEEAVAIEQATILKSAGLLKSGVRRKKVMNPGSGTKHRYRYLVRGHERIINGKSIWVKPQIRGSGEFMVVPTATSPDILVPKTPVSVPMSVEPRLMLSAPRMLLLPAPRPKPPRAGFVATVVRFFRSLFA